MKIKSCVVIGAGIGGLTIADLLSDSGVEVTVIEKESFIGGLCRRIDIDGGAVDLGPHNLHSGNKLILEYWRGLIGNNLEKRKFSAKILFNNALLNYPIKPFEIIKQLSLITLFKCSYDLFKEKIKGKIIKREPQSYEDWAISNYGSELYELFFSPLTEKVWGLPPALLDVTFAKKRLPPLSLRKTLFGIRPKGGFHMEDPNASSHYYPKFGVYELCEVIEKRLLKKNVKILTSRKISKIEEKEDGVLVFLKSEKNSDEILESDYIISSLPLTVLRSLYGGKQESSPALLYRGSGFLFLSVPATVRLPAAFIYCADRNLPFNRISDFLYCSESVCPPDKNILCVEFHADKDDPAYLDKKKDELIESLRQTGLLDLALIFSTRVEVVSTIYPLYKTEYQKQLFLLLSACLENRRLLTIGRQGLFSHSNIDEVMEFSMEAANIVLNFPGDDAKKSDFYAIDTVL